MSSLIKLSLDTENNEIQSILPSKGSNEKQFSSQELSSLEKSTFLKRADRSKVY